MTHCETSIEKEWFGANSKRIPGATVDGDEGRGNGLDMGTLRIENRLFLTSAVSKSEDPLTLIDLTAPRSRVEGVLFLKNTF